MKDARNSNIYFNMKVGQYVLVSKWSDGNSKDPWGVGFYKSTENERHFIADNDGNLIRVNGFRRMKKISANEGEYFINNGVDIEISGMSIWKILKQYREENK